MSVKLTISRHGDKVFVNGMPRSHGSMQISPTLKKEDLIVEKEGRAYLQVMLIPRVIKVLIYRMSDDALIMEESIKGNEGEITYDPWDHLRTVWDEFNLQLKN